MIFLDQPVNVGYSYSDDGSKVDNSIASAEDVYAFLQLFLKRFPRFAQAPFHVAAESYGGTYAPHIASTIHHHNAELRSKRALEDRTHVNLASVILANGNTDPYIQMASIPKYLCDGPYPVLNGSDCQEMRSKAQTCQRLIGMCYTFDSPFVCSPAQNYCFGELYRYPPFQGTSPVLLPWYRHQVSSPELGLNPYDIRKKW